MIRLENVGKIYSTNNNVSVGIRKVNLELHLGEFVAITGESGSGKSTLLNVISGIDSYEEGEMYINGEETSYFGIDDLENYRNKYVGFIFQNYNIIDSYTVLQNVETALIFSDIDKSERRKKAIELIERVGLKKHLHKKASKLSGGEKQRVVIARALAKDPLIIAADEPTGNLDSKSSEEIIELLHEVSKDKLVLIVTHDFNEVSDYATRIIRVFDGEIKEDRELKPAEKKDLPYLLDDEQKKKIGLSDTLSFSFKDVFSSPKRMIFHFIVIFVFTLILAFSVGVYKNLIKSNSDYGFGNSYSNTDDSRLVINKKDKTAFTDSEIESIKNDTGVRGVLTNDILADEMFYTNIEIEDGYFNPYFDFYLMPISFVKKNQLSYGNLPTNKGEIAIPATKDNINGSGVENLSDLIGMGLNLDGVSMTIVGITSPDNSKSDYAYVLEEDYEMFSIRKSGEGSYYNGTHTISFKNDEMTYDYISFIEPDDSLSGNEYFYHEFKGSLNTNGKIVVSSIYGNIYESGDLTFKSIEVNYDDYRVYNTIYVSKENYEAYRNSMEKVYQMSIFLDNSFKVDSYTNKYIKNGYNVVVPSEIKTGLEGISGILVIIYFIGAGISLIEDFFIVFVILLHSMTSRRSDMEILRTLGASKKMVKNMFSIEFIFLGLVSFLMVVILDVILILTTKPIISDALKAVDAFGFIVILVLISVMMYFLSLLYSKVIFKKTVRKSLDER